MSKGFKILQFEIKNLATIEIKFIESSENMVSGRTDHKTNAFLKKSIPETIIIMLEREILVNKSAWAFPLFWKLVPNVHSWKISLEGFNSSSLQDKYKTQQ